MSETKTEAAKPKARAGAVETPKTELLSADLPVVAGPAMVREWADKGVSQAKAHYEKMKTAAEEATEMLEGSIATATRGGSEYGAKMVEMMRANANAAFDLARDLTAVKSLSEFVELLTAHARKQFDTLSAQTKELTALAQKVTMEVAEPVKASVSKVFTKTP